MMKELFENQSGQSVVELSLILPVLLMLIFGFIVLGQILMAQQIVTYAAREGARTGALTNKNEDIVAAAIQASEQISQENESEEITNPTVAISPEEEQDPLRERGNILTVKVCYQYDFNIPYMDLNQVNICGQSKTRIEKSPEPPSQTP